MDGCRLDAPGSTYNGSHIIRAYWMKCAQRGQDEEVVGIAMQLDHLPCLSVAEHQSVKTMVCSHRPAYGVFSLPILTGSKIKCSSSPKYPTFFWVSTPQIILVMKVLISVSVNWYQIAFHKAKYSAFLNDKVRGSKIGYINNIKPLPCFFWRESITKSEFFCLEFWSII